MPARLKSRLPMIAAQLNPRVEATLKAGRELVAQDARSRAPDRPPLGEGLVDAIHVEGDHVLAGDDDVFWGHFQEFGTVNHPPQPFLVPALEARRGEVVASVAAVLKRL